MDELDKKLWRLLGDNCRYSYKFLGDKLGISANAARKRVDRLVEAGIIQKWFIDIKPAMIDAQFAFIEVTTTKNQNDD
ncbi:MAG: Lrp/AsnC family transcriptional regulator, partial [Candidatus Hodarchaeota archaeon]